CAGGAACVAMHGDVPAGGGGAAGRATREHTLGVDGRARGALSAGRGRPPRALHRRRGGADLGGGGGGGRAGAGPRWPRRPGGGRMVVPPHRDGGQAQYIEAPLRETGADEPFAATVAWLAGHLDEDMTVEQMAVRAVMSPRTFARRFQATMGTTPYHWLLQQR